jgi:hypothetical protein
MENSSFSRRSFFKFAVSAAAVIPFIGKMANSAAAEACPKSAPAGKAVASSTEGMGKTLNYVMDAKTSKHAKFKSGSTCGTCKFYNAAKADGGYAPCTMMGMKFVTTCGWCQSFSAKA